MRVIFICGPNSMSHGFGSQLICPFRPTEMGEFGCGGAVTGVFNFQVKNINGIW